jgi:hypothetical protein
MTYPYQMDEDLYEVLNVDNTGLNFGDNYSTDGGCIGDWWSYGINPNHVTEDYMRKNYSDMIKNYGDKIMYILVVFSYSKLKNKYRLNLPELVCRGVVNKLNEVDKAQFKNPYLLLLGYWILDINTKQINSERFQRASNIIDEIDEYKIYKPDLIRYFRLWEQL